MSSSCTSPQEFCLLCQWQLQITSSFFSSKIIYQTIGHHSTTACMALKQKLITGAHIALKSVPSSSYANCLLTSINFTHVCCICNFVLLVKAADGNCHCWSHWVTLYLNIFFFFMLMSDNPGSRIPPLYLFLMFGSAIFVSQSNRLSV